MTMENLIVESSHIKYFKLFCQNQSEVIMKFTVLFTLPTRYPAINISGVLLRLGVLLVSGLTYINSKESG